MRKITFSSIVQWGKQLITFTSFLIFTTAMSQSIVQKYGRLQVEGAKVVDESGIPVSLAGNSLFWSNAGDTADFYNAETVKHLADNWNSSIIRAAMGVKEEWDGGNGYIDSPEAQEAKIRKVVDAAIEQGIYVIIDWHTHEAEKYTEEAVAFFTKMARIYGDTPNVIYEVYNEPINQSWPVIKNYAEQVIAGIRSEDPDNLIVVGTRAYSQEVDVASRNQIDDNNVAYTLHFYAAFRPHDQLRDKAREAMDNGAALFVTEWGTIDNTGKGEADPANTKVWMDFLRENGISYANWSVSDKAFPETGSVVQGGRGISGLKSNQLTTSGEIVKDIIQNWERAVDGGNPDPDPDGDGPCASIDCIRQAMANASPGDEIIIKSGTYKANDKIRGAFGNTVYLHSNKNGTAARPIVLRGENPENPPVIEGLGYSGGYLLSLEGDYWIVSDIEFKTGSKGVVLDNANNSRLINLSVHDIGEEGIHLRDGSSDNLIDGCEVFDTGITKPGFGEGLYVGSDKSQHKGPGEDSDRGNYERSCDNNTFQNCTVGPNVAAEGADIKEGTENTIIKNSTFSAEGISGENSADAFIDLKGANTFIYGNTFNLDGSSVINAGVDFLDRGTGFKTGFRNAIFSNTFNLGSRANEIPTARKKQGDPEETHVWDNVRNPDSPDFPVSDGTTNFVTQSCPSWNIVPCEDGGGSNNQAPTVNITTPTGNRSVSSGYALQVDATASDSDGEVENVRLFIDGALVRQENFAPYTWGHSGSPNPDELNGLSEGTYTISVVATDNDGASSEDRFILTVGGEDGGGGSSSDCTFGTPSAAGLASINASYQNAFVLGNGGPSMDNFREFTINWNARNDGLYQFAFNTNNGVPDWYVEFKDAASFQFKNANPEITLSNTGISGLDGSYWVNTDGDNFVMVSKSGGYSIYFSNSSTAPSCGATSLQVRIPEAQEASAEASIALYPNPVRNFLTVSNLPADPEHFNVYDASGKVVVQKLPENGNGAQLDVSELPKGIYILEVMADGKPVTRKFIKE